MRTIKVLPDSVRSSLRSGVILFDLTRVVEELVFNSLDAGATKVTVAVGVTTSFIKVVDNGCGITRDGLVLLGERYTTSKFEHLADMDTVSETFGFRGEALGSISEVSLLEIATKARGMPNGYRKIIKGCKCLYLGIGDDRQDVGTTVTVRDLFYNQPVRRRHLQSSPKKVLHAIKECILRIAIVHLWILFKVIDIESGDDILCVYPSSSPLPLLTSGFGTEVSSYLHELDASDGVLKLTGHISSPYKTFSVKAFQYFYINSRFISKGPIHKLLNQLSARQSCSDLLKGDIGFQCGKRSRCQTFPSYILNLRCPRAYYDLTFEPSKTCVEFKDWDPVLAFIQRSISCVWAEVVPYENSFSFGANTSQKEDIWNGTDTSSTREDLNSYGLQKKRCMTWYHQASVGLSSLQPEMLREEPKHSPVPSNSKYTHERFESEFDYSLESSDRFLPQYKAPIVHESGKHLEGSDSYISSDLYYENKFCREQSSECMDHLSVSSCHRNSLETDSGTSNGLVARKPSTDSFHFVDDGGKVDKYLMKPFLRSCSSSVDLEPVVRGRRGDKESRFQADGFGKWLCMDRFDNEEAGNMNQHCEPWQDEAAPLCSPPGISTNCNLGTKSPIISRELFNPLSMSRDYFNEEDSPGPDSVVSIRDFSSSHRSSNFDCFPSTLNSPFEKIRVEPLADCLFERHFKCPIDAGFDHSADDEGMDDLYNFDSLQFNPSQEDFPSSSYMIASSSREGHASCKRDTGNSQNDSSWFPDCNDNIDETERIQFDSSAEHDICNPVAASCDIPSSYVDRRDNMRVWSRFQNNKPGRSCSAPPFYRGKKKYLALNSLLAVKSGKSSFGILNDASALQEASDLNRFQQSSAPDHSALEECSANDSLSKVREGTKRTLDKAELSNCKMKQAESLDMYSTVSDFSPKENQGASDTGGKWRNGCLWSIAYTGKPDDLHNQDCVLDISSGLLHLSADSLVPKSISKKCLEDSRVLQQVDRKFIPVVAGGILAVIDQHAADERIRLEDLRQKVLSGEMKTITYLDAERELVLPEIGYQLLHSYSEHIQKWGWICNFHSQSSTSFKKNLHVLHSQPSIATLIAVPCILGVNLNDEDLLEFLQQLADTDGSSVIPPAVLRVLNFKACRGAIMFGDALLPSECSLIVEELKQTSLCFQCAHGRPTTVPLVDLVVLNKQLAKLGKWSKSSAESWHGLSRHRPSLERVAVRLKSGGSQC